MTVSCVKHEVLAQWQQHTTRLLILLKQRREKKEVLIVVFCLVLFYFVLFFNVVSFSVLMLVSERKWLAWSLFVTRLRLSSQIQFPLFNLFSKYWLVYIGYIFLIIYVFIWENISIIDYWMNFVLGYFLIRIQWLLSVKQTFPIVIIWT